MGKINEISALYDSISAEVIKDSTVWENYLKFASKVYKYKFDNALLIYAQCPDATMVADKTTWEEKVGRAIKENTKNIAVFDVVSPKPELRFLIDIADTTGSDKTYPRLWKLTEGNTMQLLKKLNETHNTNSENLEEYAVNYALERVSNIRLGFYEGIKRNLINSPLGNIEDSEELKARVNVIILQSAVYMMYSRCGFDTGIFKGPFDDIQSFNNKFLLYRMGNCATIIAHDFLSECATTLNQLARQQRESQILKKNNIEPVPPLLRLISKKQLSII